MDLLDIMRHRRSVRSYLFEHVCEEDMQKIIQAGLLSASGRAKYPWELIVVKNHDTLKQMTNVREGSADMLKQADAAIVVIGNESCSDVWIEDCSIVMCNMHLMADALGLGSCWIQGRVRKAADGRSSDAFLRQLLKYPDTYQLEAILSIGKPQSHPSPREQDDLQMNKVHDEHF